MYVFPAGLVAFQPAVSEVEPAAVYVTPLGTGEANVTVLPTFRYTVLNPE